MKFNLGGAHWDLGWSLVMPQFRIRCQGGFISWWIWSSISKIGDNNAAGYKRISVVAEKPWYITVMSGFMNAFLNKNIFWVTQSFSVALNTHLPLQVSVIRAISGDETSHYLNSFNWGSNVWLFTRIFTILALFKVLTCIQVVKL